MTKTRTPRGTRRPIKVGGVLYPSISKASEATGVSWYNLSTAASKGQKEINRVYQAYLVATPKAEQPPKPTELNDKWAIHKTTTHQPAEASLQEWREWHEANRDQEEIERRDQAELIKNPTYISQCLKWGKEMEALEKTADELSDKYEAALNTNEQLVEQLRKTEKANAELTERLQEAEYASRTVEQLRKSVQNLKSEMNGMMRMARAMTDPDVAPDF